MTCTVNDEIPYDLCNWKTETSFSMGKKSIAPRWVEIFSSTELVWSSMDTDLEISCSDYIISLSRVIKVSSQKSKLIWLIDILLRNRNLRKITFNPVHGTPSCRLMWPVIIIELNWNREVQISVLLTHMKVASDQESTFYFWLNALFLCTDLNRIIIRWLSET